MAISDYVIQAIILYCWACCHMHLERVNRHTAITCVKGNIIFSQHIWRIIHTLNVFSWCECNNRYLETNSFCGAVHASSSIIFQHSLYRTVISDWYTLLNNVGLVWQIWMEIRFILSEDQVIQVGSMYMHTIHYNHPLIPYFSTAKTNDVGWSDCLYCRKVTQSFHTRVW